MWNEGIVVLLTLINHLLNYAILTLTNSCSSFLLETTCTSSISKTPIISYKRPWHEKNKCISEMDELSWTPSWLSLFPLIVILTKLFDYFSPNCTFNQLHDKWHIKSQITMHVLILTLYVYPNCVVCFVMPGFLVFAFLTLKVGVFFFVIGLSLLLTYISYCPFDVVYLCFTLQ